MPKLTPLPRRTLIKKLRALGFDGPHVATRHEYMRKDGQKIFIPNPHGSDIGIPILKAIIKQVGVDRDTFINT